MDFSSNSNITILRGSNKQNDIIINHRNDGRGFEKQADAFSPNRSHNSERHVSCEYITMTKSSDRLNESSGVEVVFRGSWKSPGNEKQCDKDFLLTSASYNQKMGAKQPVFLRKSHINKIERSKRCASVGPLTLTHGDDGKMRDEVAEKRISMYELASNGWIYDIKGSSKKVLDLDEEIDEIIKSDSRALVTLGDLKLIF